MSDRETVVNLLASSRSAQPVSPTRSSLRHSPQFIKRKRHARVFSPSEQQPVSVPPPNLDTLPEPILNKVFSYLVDIEVYTVAACSRAMMITGLSIERFSL